MAPPPSSWSRRVVHITVPDAPTNPYQLLRTISPSKKKHAPDPLRWLEQNSNNKFAVSTSHNLLQSVPVYGQMSTKPRAALISLVRNSELPGLIQSMRQLEYQWNRKYQYPWVFFNDEPFSDEFKVSSNKQARSGVLLKVFRPQLKILHPHNVIMKLSRKSIGRCPIGLMRAGS